MRIVPVNVREWGSSKTKLTSVSTQISLSLVAFWSLIQDRLNVAKLPLLHTHRRVIGQSGLLMTFLIKDTQRLRWKSDEGRRNNHTFLNGQLATVFQDFFVNKGGN